MNIVLRELKSNRKSLLWWCVGLLIMIAGGLAKYGGFENTGQSANEMIEAMPKSIQIVFGMNGIDLSNLIGYYTVVFSYLLLMGAIHAAMLGSNLIAKEECDRTAEFLLTKPISRITVMTAKLLAGLINLVVFNAVSFILSLIMFGKYGEGNGFTKDLIILTFGLLILQLIFFSIGTVVAATSRRPKSAAAMTTAILLITYLFSIVSALSEKLSFLKYLSPFMYVEGKELVFGDGFDPIMMLLAFIIILLSMLVAYRIYRKRDMII